MSLKSYVWKLALVSLVLLAAASPAPAGAMSLAVPSDVLGKASVKASLTASDPAGLASLFVDGGLVRSVPHGSQASTIDFGTVSLAPGAHTMRLFVRSADGVSRSRVYRTVSWRKPMPPLLVTPSKAYSGRTTPIVAKAGPGTTSLTLILNGKAVATKPATAGKLVGFGKVSLAAGVNTIVIEARNPVSSSKGTFRITRLDFPWPTCIIIDKSEYRLYWVRNGVLVKTYPIAIGKASTPTPVRTWRVGAKYVYEYWGVYGPRRLRLYKQTGAGSFEYTGYGIHGTNQEWVIGTMASHGCIRMFNRDVLELFPQVPMYTMVQTRN